MKSPKSRGSKKEESANKSGYLIFKDVTEAEAQRWLDAGDEDDAHELVRQFLRLEASGSDMRQAAILDYYSSVVLWCREHKMSAAELSVTYATSKIMLDMVESGAGQSQLVMQLKELLVGVGVAADGLSGLEILGVERLQALTELLTRTLLQHLRLYQFLFTGQPDQVIVTRQAPADALPPASLPFPPPLCEGMPEELYRRSALRTGATTATSRARTVAEEDLDAADASRPGTTASGEAAGSAVAAAAASKQLQQQQQASDLEEALAQLSPDEVQAAVNEVCRETLGGLEAELAARLKEREVAWIAKINKVHNTA